jgi:hypothetical protein
MIKMRTAQIWYSMLLLGLITLPLAGCGDILEGSFWGTYKGELPVEQRIEDERVIVRIISTSPGFNIQNFYVDRVQYLEANDPHNVNRIVEVTAREVQPLVDQLKLQVGDTIRISTRYEGIATGSKRQAIPDWPGHRYREFPIGFHALTAVEK